MRGKGKDFSLSGTDLFDGVKRAAKGEPNMIAYEELSRYKTVDELLKNDMCIILYQWKNGYGHWTCIMRRGQVIEHFDSYGLFPDKELSMGDKKMNEILGQKFPRLAEMLIASPYTIHFNHHCFQGDKSQTCGRWVLFRLWFKHVDEYSFIDSFGDFNDKDVIDVTDRWLSF